MYGKKEERERKRKKEKETEKTRSKSVKYVQNRDKLRKIGHDRSRKTA
jgi:hypothetical protein